VRHPVLLAAVLVLGGIVLLCIAVLAWYEIEANPSGPPGRPVVLEVQAGEAADTVANELAAHGVIGSSLAFRLSFFFEGTPAVTPGGYLFHQNQSFSTVRAILEGAPDVFSMRVEPGYRVDEVASRVGALPGRDAAQFEAVATGGVVHSSLQPPGSNNLEGLLGTGTYVVLPGESDADLLRQMVARFEAQAAAAGINASAAARLGMSEYQIVTVASIVEKEGYIVKNMGPVARVIYNRLSMGMELQMDSTVLYALHQDGGTVTPQDEQIPSPYNTYLTKGLPPTPICIPSVAAMTAAANPPPGPWLYFVVVDKDGTEAFSMTYAGQQANEQLAKSRGLG